MDEDDIYDADPDIDEVLADDEKELMPVGEDAIEEMLPTGSGLTEDAQSPTGVNQEEDREKFMDLPRAMPYPVESLQEMDAKLNFIIQRIIDCCDAKDFDVGLVSWNHRLTCWISLRYPMLRKTRAMLAKL